MYQALPGSPTWKVRLPVALSDPEQAARAVARIRRKRREFFVLLTLDQRHRLIRRHVISVGSASASIVHPREVFRQAIIDGAGAVIVAHNHPSGDPTPSADDVEITARLVQAGELLGIRVLDHVIVSDTGGFYSLRREGRWPGVGR